VKGVWKWETGLVNLGERENGNRKRGWEENGKGKKVVNHSSHFHRELDLGLRSMAN
jgi:hypothetical protein